jgi:hypothetical protein
MLAGTRLQRQSGQAGPARGDAPTKHRAQPNVNTETGAQGAWDCALTKRGAAGIAMGVILPGLVFLTFRVAAVLADV